MSAPPPEHASKVQNVTLSSPGSGIREKGCEGCTRRPCGKVPSSPGESPAPSGARALSARSLLVKGEEEVGGGEEEVGGGSKGERMGGGGGGEGRGEGGYGREEWPGR